MVYFQHTGILETPESLDHIDPGQQIFIMKYNIHTLYIQDVQLILYPTTWFVCLLPSDNNYRCSIYEEFYNYLCLVKKCNSILFVLWPTIHKLSRRRSISELDSAVSSLTRCVNNIAEFWFNSVNNTAVWLCSVNGIIEFWLRSVHDTAKTWAMTATQNPPEIFYSIQSELSRGIPAVCTFIYPSIHPPIWSANNVKWLNSYRRLLLGDLKFSTASIFRTR